VDRLALYIYYLYYNCFKNGVLYQRRFKPHP